MRGIIGMLYYQRMMGGNHPVPAVDLFRVIESSKDSKFDIDYLGESTKGDMNVRP